MAKKFDATHVYTGPTTAWGLQKNTDCKIVGRKLESKVIQRSDGRRFMVPVKSLKRKEK